MSKARTAAVTFIFNLILPYEDWRSNFFVSCAVFRKKSCDDSKTIVGKVSDSQAIVVMFDVDMVVLLKCEKYLDFPRVFFVLILFLLFMLRFLCVL